MNDAAPDRVIRSFSIFCFIAIMFSSHMALCQKTMSYADQEACYRKGLELFDSKNFLSAREKFEEIYKGKSAPFSSTNEVLIQNLEFYVAVCAAETNDKDAEQLLNHYLRNHHETDKRRRLYFYLGKYYYRNARYAEAAEQLAKVNITDLSNEQIYDYKFMLAYSYFIKKKFKEAKPLLSSLTGIKEKYYYPSNYYYAFICFFEKNYAEAFKHFKEIEDSKLYASVIPYYMAQIYYFRKDYDALVPYIKTNVARDGVLYKDEMNFLLGQVYFQQDEYAKALPLLEGYISKSQKVKKEDIYQLAYCQYQTGNYNKAIENFKQLNLLDDKMGQNATYALADCYLKTNQKDKARSAFQSVVNQKQDETLRENALYNFGKLSLEMNFVTDAISAFEDYKLNYDNGNYAEEVNELLATALVQTKNYDRAYKLMEKMTLRSVMIKEAYQQVTYFRAVELFNDKKPDDALKLCDKSLAYNVSADIYSLATYLKGEIYYSFEKYSEATEHYQKFNSISVSSVSSKRDASRFRSSYNIAYCYFKQKKYSDAVIYFEQAAEDAESTMDTKGKQALLPDLYLRLADCLFVTKSYQKAVDAYAQVAAAKGPSREYALFQKGIVLGLIDRNSEKIAILNSLVESYPTSRYADQAIYETGETHLSGDNTVAARSAYQNLITKYPASLFVPKSYLKLAVIDYNSGKKENALDHYKTVAKRFPETSEAREALDALKELYVELGRPQEYFDFVKGNSSVVISDSEQDSLLYQSAQNSYSANDCVKAISLYEAYISKFPGGYFINDVYWKKSDCHTRTKDFAAALVSYEGIIKNKYAKYYEKALLKASGIAYYELKDYEKALDYYRKLYPASTTQQNAYTAMLGMLQSAAKANRGYEEVVEYADQLINSGLAKEADLQEAYYLKGKAYSAAGNQLFALGAFNRVSEFPINEKCVESKYMVAKILFESSSYKASLDTCVKLKNRYAGYEYWVVKTFILMSDNYYALGNSFQAKATLESIVQNYEGDEAVLNEAKMKLEKIKTEELNKSKIMMLAPTDTLIMETDSLIINRQ